MTCLKILMVQYGLVVILLGGFFNQTLSTPSPFSVPLRGIKITSRSQSAKENYSESETSNHNLNTNFRNLTKALQRRNAQEDYDETSGLISHRGGMPRVDNRIRLENTWPRPKPRCNRRIRIQNGVTRLRDKGSLVRYECSFGFNLFGAKLAVCIRDQWSEPPPICVKLGCRRLQQPSNGVARLTFGGAVAFFFCSDDYKMEGRSCLYCDGNRWNGTEPKCTHIAPLTTPLPLTSSIDISTTTRESELSLYSLPSNFSSTESPESWDYNIMSTSLEPQGTSEVFEMSSEYTFTNTATDPTVHPIKNSTALVPHYHDFNNTTGSTIQNSATTKETIAVSIEFMTTSKLPTLPTLTAEQASSGAKTTTNKITSPNTTKRTTPKFRASFSSVTPVIKQFTPSKRTTTTPKPVTNNKNTRSPAKGPKTASLAISTIKSTIAEQKILQSTTETLVESSYFPLKTFAKFDEEISTPYNSSIPEFIQPISPHKLDTSSPHEYYQQLAHISIVGGVFLTIIGSLSLMGGIVMYCWRKNKGIARARPYDTDGRILSPGDANDDFIWMESRDSRL